MTIFDNIYVYLTRNSSEKQKDLRARNITAYDNILYCISAHGFVF